MLSNVTCTYTGGGIYVYSALFNNEVWLYGGLDNYFGSYDMPGEEIEEKDNCQYEKHEKVSSVPYPTWAEILESIRANCDEYTAKYAEKSLRYFNQDMNEPCMGQ